MEHLTKVQYALVYMAIDAYDARISVMYEHRMN